MVAEGVLVIDQTDITLAANAAWNSRWYDSQDPQVGGGTVAVLHYNGDNLASVRIEETEDPGSASPTIAQVMGQKGNGTLGVGTSAAGSWQLIACPTQRYWRAVIASDLGGPSATYGRFEVHRGLG